MAKVVVLGGQGFIGSRIAAFLKSKGLWVRVIDIRRNEETKQWWSQADEIITRDLRNYGDAKLSVSGMDLVFHLAANMGGVGFFTSNDYYPFFDNMRMSLNVLQACEGEGVKQMFFSSSACVYPTHIQKDINEAPNLSEDMIFPANSDQMYGWEKLMTLMLCQRSPVDCRVGIFHTIFGEGQEIVGDRVKFPPAIVAKVIEAERTGELRIWGDGSQLRTFLYIEDALNMVWEIMMMPKDKYKGAVNIASPELVSVREIAEFLCDYANIKPSFIYEKDKPSGVMARGVDLSKFKSYSDYRHKFTTKDGFIRLFNYIKDNQ